MLYALFCSSLSSTQRRLALVTFWNMSSPSTRAAALATLVTMVRSSEGDGSSTGEAPDGSAFEAGVKVLVTALLSLSFLFDFSSRQE